MIARIVIQWFLEQMAMHQTSILLLIVLLESHGRSANWDDLPYDPVAKVCFVEQGFLATIPNDNVIVRFHKIDDHSRREKLKL